MTQQEILDLMALQKQFYASGASREVDFRRKALVAMRDALLEYADELATALRQDLHKSEFEAYCTEIGLAISEVSHQLKLLRRLSKPQHVRRSLFTINAKSRIIYEPYGQTLIVSPWNYPVNLTLIPLAGAVATGNVVVLKVSPDSPSTNWVLGKIISKAFASEHVSMVEGHRDVNTMLFDQRWDHIFLTGSPEMGKVAMSAAAKYLTPVSLELGGKSPCIVSENADIEMAAKRIVFGKCVNCGQTCIAPDYLFVSRKVKASLVEAIKKQVRIMYGENPQQTSHYPRIVSQKSMQRLVPLLSDGDIIFGGRYDMDDRYIEPTLIENVKPGSQLLTSEIFGPILPIIEFDTLAEVAEYVSTREKPLAFYFFSNSRREVRWLLSHTTSGGACINETLMHIVNPHLPFGGVQNSGIGRYHGRYSWEAFAHRRSVLSSSRKIDFWFKYPPFSDFWTSMIKRMMR